MAEALQSGYATASTDTGHVGGRGTFALGHPEKLVDFAWRSEHEMTAKAKQIIEAFYGSGPKLSYWNGCSTGGRQGLKAAQMFPEDYDGIIAGAPANRTAMLALDRGRGAEGSSPLHPAGQVSGHPPGRARRVRRGRRAEGRPHRRSAAVPVRSRGAALQGGRRPVCLTAPQVAAAKQIYSNAVNPRTKKELFASLVPGTELGWGVAGRRVPSRRP